MISNTGKLSGSEARTLRRNGDLKAFNRRQALGLVVLAATLGDCERLFNHPNSHVKKAAFAKALKLGTVVATPVTKLPQSEFERLVERFRTEGKANPERSARASMAARAQAAQKRAA